MVNLTINSIPVTVPEGTTILDAAASVDIEIPSLCYLKELNEISACRVCCVEVEGEGKLVPSCNNVVREGMVIRTNSPRALEARRVNMELILSQHDTSARPVSARAPASCRRLQTIWAFWVFPTPPTLHAAKRPTGRPRSRSTAM